VPRPTGPSAHVSSVEALLNVHKPVEVV
jgi:hypothetical protein